VQRIVLRIRAIESMADLDLGLVRQSVRALEDLDPEVRDTRLSDAPYVTVTLGLERPDEAMLHRLQEAFRDLPRVVVQLWAGAGRVVSLQSARPADLEAASRAAGGAGPGAPDQP
jgi:hypothetical protein